MRRFTLIVFLLLISVGMLACEQRQNKSTGQRANAMGTALPETRIAEQQQHPGAGREGVAVTRIPQDSFEQSFGRQHPFVINHRTMQDGKQRFQDGGYWFELENPWPRGWAYSDQVYMDEIDGNYYLCDLSHPGMKVSVLVISM